MNSESTDSCSSSTEEKDFSSDEEVVVVLEKNAHFGEKDKEEFPEGGWGWWTAFGALLIGILYGVINGYGEYQVIYMQHYPTTRPSVISLIGSLQLALIWMSSIFVIYFHNTIGPNYTVLLGGIIMSFAFMMISLCHEIWQLFLAQSVLFSFGCGLAYFTAMAIVSEWFKRRRAMVMGILMAGSSFGGVIWPLALQRLFHQVGFAWANRILGFVYLPVAGIAAITMRKRLPRNKQQILPKWSVLKDPRYLTLGIAEFFAFLGSMTPIEFISTFANRLDNVNPVVANNILVILNACSCVARVGGSYIADQLGRLNTLIFATLLTGLLPLVVLVPAKNEAALLAFGILYGLASGWFSGVVMSPVGQLFGVQDIGSRIAIMLIFSASGVLPGIAICGSFIPNNATDTRGFDSVMIFSGVSLITGALVMLALRLSYSRKLFIFI